MAHLDRPNDPASRAFRRFREHGEPAAMTEVFDLVGAELLALAAHLLRDAGEAEDLVQEVFLVALCGARRFDPARAVTPWLVGILVKEARKVRRGHARRAARHAPLDKPVDGTSEPSRSADHDADALVTPAAEVPLARALSGEVCAAVRSALEAVPAPYREIVRGVLEDGLAPTALAASLGRAPGTVRVQLHRGLEHLRKALPRTLAPSVAAPLVGAFALEWSAGRGLAAMRAEVALQAARAGPRIALAGALVTPSLPFFGVLVMQSKWVVVLALAVLTSGVLVVGSGRVQGRTTPGASVSIDTNAASSANPSGTSNVTAPMQPVDGRRSVAAVARPSDGSTAAIGATATLVVRVVDEVGVGVSGAAVVLQPPPAELAISGRLSYGQAVLGLSVSARADSAGRATLEVPIDRALELTAWGNGRSPGTTHIAALEAGARAEAIIRLELRPDVEVPGRVVDAATGAPLAGVSVYVSGGSGSWQSVHPLPPLAGPAAITDQNGDFQAPARSWQKVGALLTCPGWSPEVVWLRDPSGVPAVGAAAPPTAPIEIALRPAGRIEGTVVGGRPGLVARARLRGTALQRDHDARDRQIQGFGREFELTATVDSLGAFTLEGVPTGVDVSLMLTEEDASAVLLREPSAVRVDAGATHRVHWTLGAGGRFVCTVRESNGDPSPNTGPQLVRRGHPNH